MANPTVIVILIAITATAAAAAAPPATQYTNHTVGGPTGWFFNATTNSSFANYSSWAASQTFNLGDYLSELINNLKPQCNIISHF